MSEASQDLDSLWELESVLAAFQIAEHFHSEHEAIVSRDAEPR